MTDPDKNLKKLSEAIDPKYKNNSLIGLGDINSMVAQVTDIMSDMYRATLVNPFSADNKIIAMPFHSMKLSYLYLGKVDSSDPSKYYVFITADELKKAYDTKELKKEQLQRWLTLLQSPCHVERYGTNRVVNFFSDSEIVLSDTGRLLGIRLACSPYSKDYIFNLTENRIKYVKIMVAYVMKFSCQYSINFFREIVDKYWITYGDKLYQELEWKIGFNELKDLIARNEPISYNWNDFNNMILKKIVKDINTFTAYKVKYEKDSYSYVESITFTIKRTASIDDEIKSIDHGSSYKAFYEFGSYKEWLEYKKSLDAKDQHFYEEATYTLMVNGGLVPRIESLRKELEKGTEYYSKLHLGWLARLTYVFRDAVYDVYASNKPNSILDDLYGYNTDEVIYNELVDQILSFQDIAVKKCTNKNPYSIGQYVLVCFDDWVKKRIKEILEDNRI